MPKILTPCASVIDEAQQRCWKEYLEELHGLEPARYDEVEAWAWARLQAKLRQLGERKVAS